MRSVNPGRCSPRSTLTQPFPSPRLSQRPDRRPMRGDRADDSPPRDPISPRRNDNRKRAPRNSRPLDATASVQDSQRVPLLQLRFTLLHVEPFPRLQLFNALLTGAVGAARPAMLGRAARDGGPSALPDGVFCSDAGARSSRSTQGSGAPLRRSDPGAPLLPSAAGAAEPPSGPSS